MASSSRWARSPPPRRHAIRPSTLRRLRRSSAPSTSRWRWPAVRPAARMIAGNTVVLKPSSDAPLMGWKFGEALRDAGLPDGVFNFVTGPGETVGAGAGGEPRHRRHGLHRLLRGRHEAVPRASRRTTRARSSPRWAARTRPSSPANADLDEAAEGVMRSAFGFDGQKCSANSRVYVERSVAREFVDKLVEKTRGIRTGDPTGARELDGTGDQPAGAGHVHRRRRGGAGRRRDDRDRRRDRMPRARLLPDADRRHRAAARASALPRRALRAVPGGRRGGLARPGAARGERHGIRPDRRHLQP